MHEPDSAALRRWEKSGARAEGMIDLGLGKAVRRYFLRVFPLAVLPGIAIGFAIALLWSPGKEWLFPSTLYFGLVLAGIAATIVGIVYNSKKVSPLVQPRRIGVTLGLTEAEAKSVQNQILGKETPDVRKWQVLRGAAISHRPHPAYSHGAPFGCDLSLDGAPVPSDHRVLKQDLQRIGGKVRLAEGG